MPQLNCLRGACYRLGQRYRLRLSLLHVGLPIQRMVILLPTCESCLARYRDRIPGFPSLRIGNGRSTPSTQPSGCARRTMPGDGFVASGQWKNVRRLALGRRTKIMSHDTDTIRSAAADAAAAPLDLLLTDIAVDPLRRLNPGGGLGPAPGRGAGQQAPVYRRVRTSAARRTGPHRRRHLSGAAVPRDRWFAARAGRATRCYAA
jgi:hypothetical protein